MLAALEETVLPGYRDRSSSSRLKLRSTTPVRVDEHAPVLRTGESCRASAWGREHLKKRGPESAPSKRGSGMARRDPLIAARLVSSSAERSHA